MFSTLRQYIYNPIEFIACLVLCDAVGFELFLEVLNV